MDSPDEIRAKLRAASSSVNRRMTHHRLKPRYIEWETDEVAVVGQPNTHVKMKPVTFCDVPSWAHDEPRGGGCRCHETASLEYVAEFC